MRSFLQRHIFTVIAAVAVVALGLTSWTVNAGWDQRRRAFEARNVARRDLLDLRAELAQAEARLSQARIDGTSAEAERAATSLSVDLRREQLNGARGERTSAASARDTKSAEAAVVRECLSGARRALDALQVRDNAATVAALQSVAAVCRAAQGSATGPVPQYAFDFPDPYVLVAGSERYAFATNATGGSVQVLRRLPDGSWTTERDALGRFPDWAGWGRTWAPSALARNGSYVLYYTVRESATGRQCISRAVALAPGGPYSDTSTAPLACGPREALDPEAVIGADGTPVLLWKRERPAAIVAQPLTPDGLALTGTERELLRADARWQGTNVEAPSMLVQGDGAWLFFSGGFWSSSRYATGVVRCASALGPCDRATAGPILASNDRIAGPGGASVFEDSPGTFGLAYHAYVSPNVGYPASRLMFTATVDLSSGRPVLGL